MASRGHKAGDVGPRVARDGARLLHSGGEDPGCQSPVSPHAACAHAGSWDGLSQRSRLKGRSRSTVQHDCREEGAMSRDERGGVDIFSTRNASHVNNRWSGKGRRAACPCIASLCMLAFLFLWITREVDWGEESFVTVSGQQFYKDCRPFYFAGFNTHDAVTAALLTPSDYNVADGKGGKTQIRDMFARAGAAGLSVVRTWVHTNDPKFPFQTGPGVYNEQAFQALDFVIAEARRSGIKLLLSLVDNWKYYNGVDQYVDWSTTAEPRTQARPSHDWGDPDPKRGQDAAQELYELRRHALFFNDTSCRNLYKNHVYAVVNRRNTFTGRLYKDDPTIMAWELLNEPRCETWSVPQCEAILQNWIEVMSAYVKEVDPNHLVTIGSEGFFGSSSSLAHMNPKSWAGDMGQDFVSNNAVKGIDFSTIHVWPDHWDRHDDEFQAKWILGLADISARVLHKPMVVEEFGKKLPIDGRHLDNILRLRDPVFQETYSAIEKSLVNGLATGGSIFWRWDLPMFEGAGRGEYGVAPEDSTFDLVTQHATFVNRWTTSQPPERHCKCECWIPHSDVFTRTCKNLPKVCDAYWEVMAGANELNYTAALNALQRTEVQLGHRLIALRGLQVYGTKSDCCHPGLGAFPKGCTWYPSFSA